LFKEQLLEIQISLWIYVIHGQQKNHNQKPGHGFLVNRIHMLFGYLIG